MSTPDFKRLSIRLRPIDDADRCWPMTLLDFVRSLATIDPSLLNRRLVDVRDDGQEVEAYGYTVNQARQIKDGVRLELSIQEYGRDQTKPA